MASDKEFVQRVKDATDLAALVGQQVKLRKQGSAHVGLCPFHAERSPSFQVIPQKGFYNCFGCGKHGDAISWVMEREGMDFGEALEHLARQAGIDMPQRRERPRAEVALEERLRHVIEAAQAYFEVSLLEHPTAKTYLTGSRGLTNEFIEQAGLGFAPESWEGLVNFLKDQDFSVQLIEQAGLSSRSERGTQIDFLRNRHTIPIRDARGRVIAFGGRAQGDAKPKYLNTRETPLFSKGSVLFGFHSAKGQMKDGALVVEGYFDVLQLHQQGINETVAPLGTALTQDHLKLISRFTKRLTLCFDGDEAGIRATEKTLRLALPEGFEVRLLMLPPGEDPDTWAMKVGKEGFRNLIKTAPDWTSFVVDRAMQGKDFRRIPDRMAVLKELLDFLIHIPDGLDRRTLFASLELQLQIPQVEFERAVREHRGKVSREAQAPAPAAPAKPTGTTSAPSPAKPAPAPARTPSPAPVKSAAPAPPPSGDEPPPIEWGDEVDDFQGPPPVDPSFGMDPGVPDFAANFTGAGDGSGEPEVDLRVDDLLRPLVVAAYSDQSARESLHALPTAWWSELPGAVMLQCVLDAEGDDQAMPAPVLARVRGLVAAAASRAGGEARLDRCLYRLEMAFIQNEIQGLVRDMQSTRVKSDPDLLKAMEKRLSEFLQRKSVLNRNQKRA